MNMLFAIIATVAVGSPTTYTEKVESVTLSIDYQKNQGLSGDIERNEVTTAKVTEKAIKDVQRFSALPAAVTLTESERKTTVYDFKDNKGKRSMDSEMSKTTYGKGCGVFIGTTMFAAGKTAITIVKDEYGIVEETYRCGKFATHVNPYETWNTPLYVSVQSADGEIRYAYTNAEETYVQRGVITIRATRHLFMMGGKSQCHLEVIVSDSGRTLRGIVIDDCDDATFGNEIKKFTDGNYTPQQKWNGSASDIMTSALTTISIQCNTITVK